MKKQNEGLYDEEKIRQTIGTLFRPESVFEVRIIRNGRKGGISGYFKNADDLLKAFDTVDLRNTNVYVTPQELDEACYDMAQQNRFIDGAQTTNDTDVKNYIWLFIDLDPKRKSGLSSTDEQRDAAFKMATRVVNYLKNHNFEEPIKAVSGNGAHLLYRVFLKNNEENRALMQNCLKALDVLFSNDEVEIDVSTFNPSRVCKLYGTMAQKGANSSKRPHRMSYIFSVPEEIKVTPKSYLEWLAEQVPEEYQPERKASIGQHREFNIETWLSDHGFQYSVKSWRDGAKKYILDQCPFNHEHKAPDSSVIVQSSGAIGFKCLHNSCARKTWKDFRLMFEPDAYDKRNDDNIDKEIAEGWKRHSEAKDATAPEDDFGKQFINTKDVLDHKEPDREYLLTGIGDIDRCMKGLQKGCVSVLSGLRSAAKSTFLSQLILTMVNNDKTVVCYSGELSAKSFVRWLMLQAAGRLHVEKIPGFENFWAVDNDDTKRRIADWMADRFWLFNNNYGNRSDIVLPALEHHSKKVNADLIIIDNLMAVDLGHDKDKYDAQTQFVWEVKKLAKDCNVHVIFVAHPRKTTTFLRLNDISGTGNIGNIVDNAFIIHRNNNDFDKAISEYLGKRKREYIAESCTNVIEVCKDREHGTQDLFVPLWYEPCTKRLLTRSNEYVRYKWEMTSGTEVPLDISDDDDYPF